MDFELSSYYPVFLFVFILLGFVLTTLVLAHLIGPRRITPVKQMPYESGMDPIGSARQKADVRFYLIAILFLVFDVELLFLYPWAVATGQTPDEGFLPHAFKDPIFWEMIAFLATLAVAYVYAWRKGVFQWR